MNGRDLHLCTLSDLRSQNDTIYKSHVQEERGETLAMFNEIYVKVGGENSPSIR